MKSTVMQSTVATQNWTRELRKGGVVGLMLATLLGWVPTAQAQPQGFETRSLSQISQISQAVSRTGDSRIVITIGDGKDICGNRFSLNQVGLSDGFDFPKPGGVMGSFDFPRPGGATSSLGYPAPIGTASTFQLPQGTQQPDIVGCVDSQRNIVFINIRPRVIQEKVVVPQPPEPKQPSVELPPLQPPQVLTPPRRPGTYNPNPNSPNSTTPNQTVPSFRTNQVYTYPQEFMSPIK